jgi:hypothetical protein
VPFWQRIGTLKIYDQVVLKNIDSTIRNYDRDRYHAGEKTAYVAHDLHMREVPPSSILLISIRLNE